MIEIGTMDDEEGRKIMYEREKILSKKIADILKSFNKDRLRKDVVDRSLITGESTIIFERIAQDRIFKSISKLKLFSIRQKKKS